MAALAEALVDEWLNRNGYFTVRGLKVGVSEIDLLGVRPRPEGVMACHVEVQVSARPRSYISPLPKGRVAGFAQSRTSAKRRPSALLEESVAEWVVKKYRDPRKAALRARLWPGAVWEEVFVHGIVVEPKELACIASHGIRLIPFAQVLAAVRHDERGYRGGAGTDIAELIEFFGTAGVASQGH